MSLRDTFKRVMKTNMQTELDDLNMCSLGASHLNTNVHSDILILKRNIFIRLITISKFQCQCWLNQQIQLYCMSRRNFTEMMWLKLTLQLIGFELVILSWIFILIDYLSHPKNHFKSNKQHQCIAGSVIFSLEPLYIIKKIALELWTFWNFECDQCS